LRASGDVVLATKTGAGLPDAHADAEGRQEAAQRGAQSTKLRVVVVAVDGAGNASTKTKSLRVGLASMS